MGFVEPVELLLSNGADVHHKCNRGATALAYAIHKKHPSVEAVLRAHLEKEKRKQLGEALLLASIGGDLPEVRRLLALGADARYQLEEGKSKGLFPLYAASQYGHAEVIEALIAGGADPNQDGGKFSPPSLIVAASHNQPSVIAALVKAGADVNLANSLGIAPLGIAATQGHREAVIALLVAKAAVNIADNNGRSPMHMAAKYGHVEILKLLIKAKGDVNQGEKNVGQTPLMIASEEGFVEAVGLLRE